MSDRTYEIRQEPGAQARRRAGQFGVAPKKLLATVEADMPSAALQVYIGTRQGKTSYVTHRLEWQSERSYSDRWHADDGREVDGRQWRAILTLRNGRYIHDVVLVAWKVQR